VTTDRSEKAPVLARASTMAGPRTQALVRFAREHRLALGYGGIVFLAAILRYTGLGFSASVPWGRPDEEIFVQIGMRLFGDDNPHVSEGGWPELWFRAHHLMQQLLLAWWRIRYGEDIHLGCVFALSPDRILVPMRIVSATFAVLTVPLVMRLGYLVGPITISPAQRHSVAMASGLFYAVNVLAARDAHFAVSDQPLLFFMVWMFVAMAQGVERGYLRDFFACGLALGLAIGTKWTGLPFGIVPAMALAVFFRRHGLAPVAFAALMLGIAGFALGFLVTNPTFLHLPQPFIDGVSSVAIRYDPNAPRSFSIYTEAPIVLGIERHALVSFPFAIGWPLTILAAIGSLCSMTIWARRKGAVTFIVGFWTLFFYAGVVGRTTMYFARYSLPAHPTACVGAALVVVLGVQAIAQRWEKGELPNTYRARRRGLVLAGVVALLVMEPTVRSFEYVAQLARPDTREAAVDWLREHAGDTPIDMVGGYSRPLAMDDHLADLCEARLPAGFAEPALRLQGAPNISRWVTDRPATWHPMSGDIVYSALLHNVGRITAEWAVVAQPWLPCGQRVSRYAAYDPPACYTEVARFDPEGVECDAMFDDQDHFYGPLWGFERPWTPSSPTAARIGPSIVIYHRDCDATGR
jgi:hypothetical protein